MRFTMIGDTRRKALMRYFKSLEAIREASEEELAQVPGMASKSECILGK